MVIDAVRRAILPGMDLDQLVSVLHVPHSPCWQGA